MAYATLTPWITLEEFALWCKRKIAANDERANLILRATIILINDTAGLYDTAAWTADTAPDRVKLIYIGVAKRNYLNPNQVIREGSIGPIGGDAYAESFAAGMDLTDYEITELQRLAGVVNTSGQGDITVISFTTGRGRRGGNAYFLGDKPGSDPILMFTATGDPYYFPVVGSGSTTEDTAETDILMTATTDTTTDPLTTPPVGA
ncbi:MAG: hypothetical protein M3Q39_10020 [Actinomycetota bacterium]|nr:hypothetical protein [Actinomycetota bacterium]